MDTTHTLPPPSAGLPTSVPVASTSAPPPPTTSIRCSQCKKTKPLSDFPVRLINLQPYQVCRTHTWYWTKEKQAVHWVPEEVKSIERVSQEVLSVRGNVEGAVDKWMVKAASEDRAALVQRIATAGGWKSKALYAPHPFPLSPVSKLIIQSCSNVRKSGAKSDSPPHPTFHYSLNPLPASSPSTSATPADDSHGTFKLILYQHEADGSYTMTLRSDDKKKAPLQPWARPERVRKTAKDKEEGAGGAGEAVEGAEAAKKPKKAAKVKPEKGVEKAKKKAATPAKGKGKGKGKAKATEADMETEPVQPRLPLQSNASFDLLVDAASALTAAGDIVVDVASPSAPPPPTASKRRSVSNDRSSQEMPPPPVPPPRPPKKARRVEPSLISSHPSTASSLNPSPFSPSIASTSSNHSWAGLFSFPEFIDPSLASPQQLQPPAAPVAHPFDYSTDAGIMAILNSLTPSSTSTALLPTSNQPLTLADLLANPYFDPPNIPLPPRPPPTPAPPQPIHPHAPRASSRLRTSTSSFEDASVEQGASARQVGQELDEAVAAALEGAVAAMEHDATEEALDDEEEEEEEEDDEYYEDSIPDDSSEEEEEGESGGGTTPAEYDLREHDTPRSIALDEDATPRSFGGSEVSAEETESVRGGERGGYSGSGGDDGEDSEDVEEEEDGDEDWLAGFALRQMPGLSNGGGMGQEEDEEERQWAGQNGKSGGGGKKGGSSAANVEEVDELDELDSGAE